ncbi:hypothetical protein [Microbacterium resistens]|uniref:hypothetical protein n=1 Tax=Microbacterium resistens TaxID=156977 RepID=UPI00366E5739
MTTRPNAPSPRILLEDSYATYPHSNGYYGEGGRRVALGRADASAEQGAGEIVGVRWGAEGDPDPEVLLPADVLAEEAGTAFPVWTPEHPTRSVPWFDIAVGAPVLICARGSAVLRVQLAGPGRTPSVVYRAADGWSLDGLTSVAADGRTAVISEGRRRDDGGSEHRALLLDLASGATREIVRHPWRANHFHFSPADESWIGYAHEGAATAVDDRLWAWHPQHAPEGRPVVDQRALAVERGARGEQDAVALGHERWMFHDSGAVVIAYGESPVGPRGVYEVFVDERAPRLVSAGDRDWHVGVSRDGRRIVVDTTGPADAPGRGWADAGTASTIVLVDAATGSRRTLAETGFIAHPYHPHPSFTPDGSAVVFSHVERDAAGRILRRGAAVVPVA